MAAIYLIRHGQASFGKADYDQLSDKGAEQAQLLGKYWQSLSAPNKLYAGDLLRHGQTLDNFLTSYQGNEAPMIIHSGFNEFNHVDILTCYNDQWHNFSEMSADINKLKNPNKTFQNEFAQALNRWILGDHHDEYKESWPQFKERCIRALNDVIQKEIAANKKLANKKSSKDIIVFTSGGTISVIIQHILELSDSQALMINQQLRNTSVTKLLFSEKNLSVDYLNNYSHLEQAGSDWVTFR